MDIIVENILSNLSEVDIANAMSANSKWAAVVTSRRRAEQYFTGGKNCATLKTLYRRRELQREYGQRDARAIFEQACADRLKLDIIRDKRDQCLDGFKVVHPFDSSDWTKKVVFVGNEYIATGYMARLRQSSRKHCSDPHWRYLTQLHDRWTLQLVNAITLRLRSRLSHKL